jgi:HlyD family secretion protein
MTTGRDRRSLLFVTAILMLAAAGGRGAPVAAAEDKGATPAQKEGVYCLGRIEPRHGIRYVNAPSMVNAVNGAVLKKLLVEAGDNVTAGQVVAVTDTADVEEGNFAIAKAELELAERRSEQAAGEEQDVCSRSEVAQRTASRRSRLLKSGVTSDEEADVAAGDARALTGSCNAARMATKAAAAGVDVAKARVTRAQAELDRCYVKAPMDGRILRIIKRPGELLGLDGILEMGDVHSMYAIAEVYETDIGRVHEGQKATVTSSALSAPLTGVVEHLRQKVRKQDATGTDPASRKDARIVEVEVLLDKPEAVAGLSNLQVDVLLQP